MRISELKAFPVKAGEKVPVGPWQEAYYEQAGLLSQGYNVGIPCGKSNGGLIVLDFDDRATFAEWSAHRGNYLGAGRVDTPNGVHLYYQMADVPGSQKLASTPEREVLVETRGEGAYVVGPGSIFQGKRYVLRRDEIPTIFEADWEDLVASVLLFNQALPKEYKPVGRPSKAAEKFALLHTWDAILEPHGWRPLRLRGDGVTEWTRPGKTEGVSATTGAFGKDIFYVFSSNAAPFEPNTSYSKYAAWAFLNWEGDFKVAHSKLVEMGLIENQESAYNALVNRCLEEWPAFVDRETRAACVVLDNGTAMIEDPRITAHLHKLYRDMFGKHAKPGMISDCTKLLESAAHEAGMKNTFDRIGVEGERVYVDLYEPATTRAVEIDSRGWRVVEEPPVLFRRFSQRTALPEPSVGGALADLRSFINVGDTDFILLCAWVMAAFNPHGGAPILVIEGPAGSGKSTLAKFLRALIDPAVADVQLLPRDVAQLINHTYHHAVLSYDNISSISRDMSDALCSVATGASLSVRQLYTDRGEVVLRFRKPVILNGLGDISRQYDFAGRALVLRLTVPEHYRAERVLKEEFKSALPYILGSLYTCVSAGLRNIATTKVPPGSNRLVDFRLWCAAVNGACFWSTQELEAALEVNNLRLQETLSLNDVVADAVAEFMQDRSEWSGSPTMLYTELCNGLPRTMLQSSSWPGSPAWLRRRLTTAAAYLQALQIYVTIEGREITIRRGV